MEVLLQQIINALNTGSIYALVAIGYTMVYGIIKLINFAHGDIMMFGAYFGFLFATIFPFQLPLMVIIAMSMILAALMGVIIEKVAYKKLRNAPRISALITAIGVSLLLQNLALLIFSSDPKVMPPLISTQKIYILGLDIPTLTVYTISISVSVMVA